jgi:hypothetical protein
MRHPFFSGLDGRLFLQYYLYLLASVLWNHFWATSRSMQPACLPSLRIH